MEGKYNIKQFTDNCNDWMPVRVKYAITENKSFLGIKYEKYIGYRNTITEAEQVINELNNFYGK